MAAPLALPAGDRTVESTGSHPLAVGSLIACIGLLGALGALVAAYLGLRVDNPSGFPPEDVVFDTYLWATLAITALMASVTVEWACHALRHGERGQALAAWGITTGLGVAMAIGIWYLLTELGAPAGSSPYGVVVTAILGLTLFAWVGAVIAAILAFARAAGGQLEAMPWRAQARATAHIWHLGTAAWHVAWLIVFFVK